MSYNSTVRDEIFARLGTYVRWWYDLEAMKTTLDNRLAQAADEFHIGTVPSKQDRDAYEAFSIEVRRQKDDLDSLRQSVVNLVSQFFGDSAKSLLGSAYSSPDAVLNQLIDEMGDYGSTGDSVPQNTLTDVTAVTEDEDNSVKSGDGLSLDFGVELTHLAQNDEFSLTCADDSTVDQERWTLESARLGQYYGQVTTGQAVAWDQAGLGAITIPAAPLGYTSTKISDLSVAGLVRGRDIASDGGFYLQFKDVAGETKENDELGQISSLSFLGSGKVPPPFGSESDTDGKLYISVLKDPSALQVLGGTLATISATDLIIDGADGDNTDNGTLYVAVVKANGTSSGSKYTVNLYSNSARTTLVAHQTIDNVTEDTVPADPFNLIADGSSGLTGQLTLSDFASVENRTDSTILIKVPRYFVQIYRSSSRSGGDLVSEGYLYTPAGTVDLTPPADSDFTATGTVSLNYVQDNDEIVVGGLYHTIDIYKADPTETTTTDDDIIGRAGSMEDLLGNTELSGSLENDLPFYSVNGSGLTSATVDIDDSVTVADGTVVEVKAGFANGDVFTFDVNVTDDGRFQTFLRDNFAKVFPSSDTPTIADPEVQTMYPVFKKLVFSSPVLNLKTVADVDLLTVPAGYGLQIDTMEIVTTAVTTAGTAPTLRFGNSSDRDAYYGPVQTLSNSQGKREMFDVPQDLVAEGTVVSAGVTIGSTATTHSGILLVTGSLIMTS